MAVMLCVYALFLYFFLEQQSFTSQTRQEIWKFNLLYILDLRESHVPCTEGIRTPDLCKPSQHGSKLPICGVHGISQATLFCLTTQAVR
jgi:hypothetical protein